MRRSWEYRLPRGGELAPDALWIARDVLSGPRVTKVFRRCATFLEYELALLESADKHLYEVIPDGERTPVWFFADHDCREEAAGGMDADGFVAEVCRVHLAHFGLPASELGNTVFVSSTCRPGKLSVHVKVNLQTTLAGARLHAQAVLEACGGDDRIKPDMSVYSSRAQQIRAVGSSKHGCSVRKAPVPGCEGPLFRHLVRVSPTHGMPVVSRDPPASLPPAKRARTAFPAGEAIVRAALASSLLPGLFGEAFDPSSARLDDVVVSDDGETIRCYLDGSENAGGTVRCPLAGRVHRHNRASLALAANGGESRPWAPGTGEIVYRCFDEECRENAKRVVAPYDVRGSAILRDS